MTKLNVENTFRRVVEGLWSHRLQEIAEIKLIWQSISFACTNFKKDKQGSFQNGFRAGLTTSFRSVDFVIRHLHLSEYTTNRVPYVSSCQYRDTPPVPPSLLVINKVALRITGWRSRERKTYIACLLRENTAGNLFSMIRKSPQTVFKSTWLFHCGASGVRY